MLMVNVGLKPDPSLVGSAGSMMGGKGIWVSEQQLAAIGSSTAFLQALHCDRCACSFLPAELLRRLQSS